MQAKSKALIFDCQLLQTKAWHRGMGKYTAKLLDAFLKNEQRDEEYEKIVFLFNEKLAFSDELSAFAHQRGAEVKFLSLDVPVDGDQHAITLAQQTNRQYLDAYIDEELANMEVGFCITSLFLDEACPTFPSSTYNSLIYYDLIPLMYYRLYLGLGASEQYFTRFSILFEADQIFAISETVANDIVTFLGLPAEKVVNIRGASNHVANDRHAIDPKLSITKPFILMPTGGDPRKNNLNGVKGFNLFNEQNGNRYQLIITSIFTEQQKEELNKYSSDLIFSDNVSDSELWWLYEKSEAVLFPTEYEGLGMPILEAIDANKLIVCSDIPVFKEISTEAFFTFDPADPAAIGNAIEEAVIAEEDQIKSKTQHYKKISDLYTWESSAVIVGAHILKDKDSIVASKKRIAIVTPNICQASEGARYAALQYANLNKYFEVDYYYDMSDGSYPVRPSHLAFTANICDINHLSHETASLYDLVVYIIEDSKKSIATLQAALAIPGLVVLADGSVKGVFVSAKETNVISTERYEQEDESFISSLSAASLALVAPQQAINAVKPMLDFRANKLAYPVERERSLYSRIFVNLDAARNGDEYNINYINEISSAVDQSRVNFIVATRTRFSPEVHRRIAQPSVALYEDLSDHEFNTLLMGADLYVDARPGDSIDKIFPAYEASEYGLTVLLNKADEAQSHDDSFIIARGANELCDMTYQWLIGALDVKRVVEKSNNESSSLVGLIKETIENREK